MRAWIGVWLAAALLLPAQVTGRREEAEPAVGRLLVAARELRDPNFAQTVVLLVSYGRSGAMGLVLNRKTTATVGKVMESSGESRNAGDPVYSGGPVRRGGVLALVRGGRRPEEATRVVGDVHMASSREVVDEQVRSGARGDVLRLYAGYSGWGPGQLEREIESGAWHVFNGDAATAFDGETETLWNRFIRRTELRFAGLRQVILNQRPNRDWVKVRSGRQEVTENGHNRGGNALAGTSSRKEQLLWISTFSWFPPCCC